MADTFNTCLMVNLRRFAPLDLLFVSAKQVLEEAADFFPQVREEIANVGQNIRLRYCHLPDVLHLFSPCSVGLYKGSELTLLIGDQAHPTADFQINQLRLGCWCCL